MDTVSSSTVISREQRRALVNMVAEVSSGENFYIHFHSEVGWKREVVG